MKLKHCSLIIASISLFWGSALADSPLYKDATAPVETRITDLLGRMTMDDKLAQMQHIFCSSFLGAGNQINKVNLLAQVDTTKGFIEAHLLSWDACAEVMNTAQQHAMQNTPLGIPIFTCAESLHGLVQDGATVFPQAIALGSTFNLDLMEQMTLARAVEVKLAGVNQVWSPVLDVGRDLRWGRIEECLSEDPFLIAEMGVVQVKTFLAQGISTMLKHFGAHGQPASGLNLASVFASEREVRSIHLKPFEEVIKRAKPWAVMSSYNSVNHVPNSANKELMTDILRGEWGFEGYVYSDWGATTMLNYFHRVAANGAEAALMALTAGLDVEAGASCYTELPALVEKGVLDVGYIDLAVSRVLRAKFEMGLFEWQLDETLDASKMRCAEHVALARKLAEESLILMQNRKNLLPLDATQLKSVALIGPSADQVQLGDYTWARSNDEGVNPREALTEAFDGKIEINYAKGCDMVSLDKSGFASAIEAAEKSDVVIVCVGTSSASMSRDYHHAICGEGFDINDMALSGVQEDLIKELHKTGKDVIVVLISGKPMAMPWVKENIDTVITQWYPGEQGGYALADVLLGKVNPSGHLNYTFPQSTGHMPCFYNYLPSDKGLYKNPGKIGAPGRDYVFSSPDALWSFGHGMSYTTFEYSNLQTDKEDYSDTDTITLTVDVKNTGSMDGKDVVQVYVRDVWSSVVTPVHQLKGFAKPLVKAGEQTTVQITIPVRELGLYNSKMEFVVEPGEFEIQIGQSSTQIDLRKIVTVNKDQANQLPVMKLPTKEARVATGEKIVVKGIVRDIQLSVLPGVEIVSEFGRVESDANGEFEIEVRTDGELSIQREGKEVMTKAIDGAKSVNITLDFKM